MSPRPFEAILTGALPTREGKICSPPGAGKTTRAPLALLDKPWAKGKRLILSNRLALPPEAVAWPRRISPPLLYVNIGAMPGSALAIARRYAGRCPMRSR